MRDECAGFLADVNHGTALLRNDRPSHHRSSASDLNEHTHTAPQAVMVPPSSCATIEANSHPVSSTTKEPVNILDQNRAANDNANDPSPSVPVRQPDALDHQGDTVSGPQPANRTHSHAEPALPTSKLKSGPTEQLQAPSNQLSAQDRQEPATRESIESLATPPRFLIEPSPVRSGRSAPTHNDDPRPFVSKSQDANVDAMCSRSTPSAGRSKAVLPSSKDMQASGAAMPGPSQLPSSASHTQTSIATARKLSLHGQKLHSDGNASPRNLEPSLLQNLKKAVSDRQGAVIVKEDRECKRDGVKVWLRAGQVVDTPDEAWYIEHPCPGCQFDGANPAMRMDWIRYSWGDTNKCSTCRQAKYKFGTLEEAASKVRAQIKKLKYSFPPHQREQLFDHLYTHVKLRDCIRKRKRTYKNSVNRSNTVQRKTRRKEAASDASGSRSPILISDDEPWSDDDYGYEDSFFWENDAWNHHDVGDEDSFIGEDDDDGDCVVATAAADEHPRAMTRHAANDAESSTARPSLQSNQNSPAPTENIDESNRDQARHDRASQRADSPSLIEPTSTDQGTSEGNTIARVLMDVESLFSSENILSEADRAGIHTNLCAIVRDIRQKQEAKARAQRKDYEDDLASLEKKRQELQGNIEEKQQQLRKLREQEAQDHAQFGSY